MQAQPTAETLAHAYRTAVRAAESASVSVEPEAQLTTPVQVLVEGLATLHRIGRMQLLRESQLPGVRPDFAALVDGTAVGWVELKAPGHSLDGPSWRGRERGQWERLSELDALVVCNGEGARLYQLGEFLAEATLPYEDGEWDPQPLVDLLRTFAASRPPVIIRVSQLADRLAPMARMLRDRIRTSLSPATRAAPVVEAKNSWSTFIHEGVDDDTFSDDLAQVVAYSMAIAALHGGADRNHDRLITLDEARAAIRGPHGVLAAALGPVLDTAGLMDVLAAEVGAIERLASAVDAAAVARHHDSRGEPWLWFYEDFLAKYDPDRRRAAGVYYTPTAVVNCQVRLIDEVLRGRLRRALGFGSSDVVTLDPATGSGTYPLAVIDQAERTAVERRGPAGAKQISPVLARNLIAFEMMPGPYAVAHLRIGQRLAEMGEVLHLAEPVRVYLTDTLEDPTDEGQALPMWGDAAMLTAERARARAVKTTDPVTVILGNPPYERRSAASGGGWVVHPSTGRALFDDVLDPARQHVIFSAHASLYNDYVYFWRWALWKAFEQRPSGPAVVSFITASSWLSGPGFLGLRRLARQHADEVWVVDLGGDGRGTVTAVDDNVFDIQTPVAIVTLIRKASTTPAPARVLYRRLSGTRAQKLAALEVVGSPDQQPDEWTPVSSGADEPMVPPSGVAAWPTYPALTDLFPWQQPGVMFNRTWPVSPDPDVLVQRWEALLARTDHDERAAAYVTGSSGRTIDTQVAGLRPLSELQPGARHEPVVPLAHRSFDRQWTFSDPRLINLERPALWRSLSPSQLFLSTMTSTALGTGPALTVATAVPDKHYFRGSYGGKDVIPLYRDAAATRPNVTEGLLPVLEAAVGAPVGAEDLAAYVYALLAHPAYQRRFAEELRTPGPRVPLTADGNLFAEAVELGRRLLWLQTFGERFRDPAADRGFELPAVPGLQWTTAVAGIPESMDEVRYDAAGRDLCIGTGVVSGVAPEVWAFSVSGLAVVQRWIATRTRRGTGRAATRPQPLDLIRPTAWRDEWNDELLDLLRVLSHTVALADQQADLLDRVCDAPLLPAAELPQPAAHERRPPSDR